MNRTPLASPASNTGMMCGRGRARLADEPLAERAVQREAGREDLQRHLPVEALVVGPEDDRHPALADLLQQPVAGDLRARREAARGEGMSSFTAPPALACLSGAPSVRPARRGCCGHDIFRANMANVDRLSAARAGVAAGGRRNTA